MTTNSTDAVAAYLMIAKLLSMLWILCKLTISLAGGDWWTDSYALRPIGVLECPSIEMLGTHQAPPAIASDEDDWVVVREE